MKKPSKLYFGVRVWDTNRKEFMAFNVFDHRRVAIGAALWRLMSPLERRKVKDPLSYIFGDLWGRTEYEFRVSELNPNDRKQHSRKTNVFDFFIVPNREMLLVMVENMPASQARSIKREWLW